MRILWSYLKPHKWLVTLSLALAGVAQVLAMVDPIIFGKIIDEYATNPLVRTDNALVEEAIFWLGIAVGVAPLVAARSRSSPWANA